MKYEFGFLGLAVILALTSVAHADGERSRGERQNYQQQRVYNNGGRELNRDRGEEERARQERARQQEEERRRGDREQAARNAERARAEERARFERQRGYDRDNWYREHAEIRRDWRWEWRGNACGAYVNNIWTPYGVEYCRNTVGTRYFWLNGQCREYTTLGIFLQPVEEIRCGGIDTRVRFGWNGRECYEFDNWDRALVAVDLGFCRTEFGTHFAWYTAPNGQSYCAEFTNGSNIWLRYTVDANGYADPTPCYSSSYKQLQGKGENFELVALDDQSLPKLAPAAAPLDASQGASSKPAQAAGELRINE